MSAHKNALFNLYAHTLAVMRLRILVKITIHCLNIAISANLFYYRSVNILACYLDNHDPFFAMFVKLGHQSLFQIQQRSPQKLRILKNCSPLQESVNVWVQITLKTKTKQHTKKPKQTNKQKINKLTNNNKKPTKQKKDTERTSTSTLPSLPKSKYPQYVSKNL